MVAKKSASALEDHAGYWLRYVSNHVSHAFSQKVGAEGVTVAEWVVLRELFEAGPANPSRIAHDMGMTRGTVSKLVERLCRKNLAVRSSSEGDRRYQTVELTTAGKRLVPVLAQLADENDREFFGHLKANDRTWLMDLLRDVVRRNGWKATPVD